MKGLFDLLNNDSVKIKIADTHTTEPFKTVRNSFVFNRGTLDSLDFVGKDKVFDIFRNFVYDAELRGKKLHAIKFGNISLSSDYVELITEDDLLIKTNLRRIKNLKVIGMGSSIVKRPTISQVTTTNQEFSGTLVEADYYISPFTEIILKFEKEPDGEIVTVPVNELVKLKRK